MFGRHGQRHQGLAFQSEILAQDKDLIRSKSAIRAPKTMSNVALIKVIKPSLAIVK